MEKDEQKPSSPCSRLQWGGRSWFSSLQGRGWGCLRQVVQGVWLAQGLKSPRAEQVPGEREGALFYFLSICASVVNTEPAHLVRELRRELFSPLKKNR